MSRVRKRRIRQGQDWILPSVKLLTLCSSWIFCITFDFFKNHVKVLFMLIPESLGGPINMAPQAGASLLHCSPSPGLAFQSRSLPPRAWPGGRRPTLSEAGAERRGGEGSYHCVPEKNSSLFPLPPPGPQDGEAGCPRNGAKGRWRGGPRSSPGGRPPPAKAPATSEVGPGTWLISLPWNHSELSPVNLPN